MIQTIKKKKKIQNFNQFFIEKLTEIHFYLI